MKIASKLQIKVLSLLLAAFALNISACVSADVKRLKGAYYWGAEEEVFIPCASQNAFWIIGSDSVLGPIRRAAESAGEEQKKASSPLFVEIFAKDRGKAKDGFAMDYESVYEVRSVRIIAKTVDVSCNKARRGR